MGRIKASEIARTAMLTAAALIVYVIEAQIPPLTPIAGIKLGLSNIFTLFALYALSPREAVSVLLLRVTLGGLLTAQPSAIIYSLSGAIPSFILSLLCYKKFPQKQIWVLSAASALFHNAGQLCMAIIITGTKELILYMPVLAVSGIITGIFTGLCAQLVLSRIGRRSTKVTDKDINNVGGRHMRKLSGVRIPHNKNTALMPSVELPLPNTVTIPMSMHIGAPAKAVVKPGEDVKVGQLIGEAGGFVSAPIHSSVSGKVKGITEITTSSGSKSPAVVIESDGLQTPFGGLKARDISSYEGFLAAVRDSGAVGLGGAGFPTSVKLTVKDAGQVETIIINGAECEPYITSDTRTMVDSAELIIEGAKLLLKFFPRAKIEIGIENNKPEPIKALSGLCKGQDRVCVRKLPPVYPQGGEKVLIYSLTGKIVPEGKLPLDVGVIVVNCTTLACIMRFIKTGMPLVSKCLTVDGSAVKQPKNVTAPIGTPISEVLDFCGVTDDMGKVLMGGPMMGIAAFDISSPVLKNNNAILAFRESDSKLPESTACIRCGRCVRACPMHLMPLELETAYTLKNPERLQQLKVNLCMECGCCAYICPAARPLVQNMKLSKLMLRSYQEEQKAKKEAAV